jgi:hypothetical protein
LADAPVDVGPETVLDRVESAEVHLDPFPHLVVRNALSPDYYEELSRTFPTLEGVPIARAKANNRRLDLLSSWGPAELPPDRMPPAWRRFVDDHATLQFARKVLDQFPAVMVHPADGGERNVSVSAFGSGLPDRLGLPDTVPESSIVARATLGVNTPVTISNTSVRGPHVDSPRKAYVGLFYVRHPDDRSIGGDFAIYRVKDGAQIESWGQKISADDVELVRVVDYGPNTYVLMLNTEGSLHGVTNRSVTSHLRRFAITSGWFPGVDSTSTDRNSLTRR